MVAQETKHPAGKRPRGRPPIVRTFYGSALDAATRTALKYAADIEGLDLEIDLLRTKLRELLSGRSEDERANDFRLMVRGMELLVKLVSARYRLSPRAGKDLGEKLAAVVDELSVLLPAQGSGT